MKHIIHNIQRSREIRIYHIKYTPGVQTLITLRPQARLFCPSGATLIQHREREKLYMYILFGRFGVRQLENDSFLLVDEIEVVLNYK